MTPPVAIVGGGPAGAAVAITLAQRGISVVVYEQAPAPRCKLGECLPPTASRVLEVLGVRCALALGRDHLQVPGTRACWGSHLLVDHEFVGGHGWHLDRAAFELLLSERATQLGVDWRWGCRLERVDIGAAFVVDATGRRAAVARRLGAKRVAYDRLLAIGGVLQATAPIADRRVLVEAVPGGWWYSAALADARMVVSYFTDADLARPTLAVWLEEMRQAPRTWELVTSGFDAPKAVSVAAASSSRLTEITGPGWLAVGDAAAAHDPLASYGLLAALGGGIYAAHAIADYLAGDSLAMAAYLHLQQNAYARYLEGCLATYAAETRWPDAPFWSRRALIAS